MVYKRMDLSLDGKTALITGSSKGIGKVIAKTLHAEGCNIVLNGRNKKTLIDSVKEFERSSYCVADVTNPKSCEKLVSHVIKKWKKLDILICNVGNGSSVPPGSETYSEWKRMLDINLFSATNMIEASKKYLEKTNGCIVCISSISGIEVTGAPVTYSTAKAALNAFVKSVSKYLSKNNIRINAVAPGNILFQGSVWEKKFNENPYKVKKMLKENVSLQRLGTPSDVANTVTFLSSPKSSFITGVIFVVDGGQVRS